MTWKSFTAPSRGSVEVLSLRPQPLPRLANPPPPTNPEQTLPVTHKTYRLGPFGQHRLGARMRALRLMVQHMVGRGGGTCSFPPAVRRFCS